MNGTASRSLQQHPNIQGCLAWNGPAFRNDAFCSAQARLQLKAIQQLTGNKTFPFIRDQYTIGQSHCKASPNSRSNYLDLTTLLRVAVFQASAFNTHNRTSPAF